MKPIFMAASLLCAMIAAADKAPKEIKCPVQGFKIDIAEATKTRMYTDYKGRRYFFCCAGCPETFKANPAKYAKTAESIPTQPKKKARPNKKS